MKRNGLLVNGDDELNANRGIGIVIFMVSKL